MFLIQFQEDLKLYFVSRFYGKVETGFYFFSWDGTNNTSDSETVWRFSAGTGYEIPLSENVVLDLSTKYQYNLDYLSYWNIYVSLMFGL